MLHIIYSIYRISSYIMYIADSNKYLCTRYKIFKDRGQPTLVACSIRMPPTPPTIAPTRNLLPRPPSRNTGQALQTQEAIFCLQT